MSPYRSGSVPECPRCGDAMMLSRDVWVCTHGCGEWLEHEWLRGLKVDAGELGYVDARTTSLMFCPSCQRRLELRRWAETIFEWCASHGVWLETKVRASFHAQLAAAVDDERAVRELAALFETTHGRRELARRILALEAQAARLQRKVDDG